MYTELNSKEHSQKT